MDRLNVSMVEAAKLVGLQISRMQALIEAGEVPAWRDGRNWKIPVEALQEWNNSKAWNEAERRRNGKESEAEDS